MKLIPDKYEIVALLSVWLMWPAFYLAARAIIPILSEFGANLPLPTRLALEVLQANRLCIPSLVGTAAVVLAGRLSPTPDINRFLCHLITFASFAFTLATVLGLLGILRAIK